MNKELWKSEGFRCLRECNSQDIENYILSKIHKMSTTSLEYISNILEYDKVITIEQAITIFEGLKYRIKEIFHRDIYIEINILEDRINGKIIYKNKNMIIFDFPLDKNNSKPSNYLEEKKADTRETVFVPNLEGEEEDDIESMLKALFEEKDNE